ncbi:hypothetical protein VTO42DRAFT_7207 [Malbranchea cinnamomea]
MSGVLNYSGASMLTSASASISWLTLSTCSTSQSQDGADPHNLDAWVRDIEVEDGRIAACTAFMSGVTSSLCRASALMPALSRAFDTFGLGTEPKGLGFVTAMLKRDSETKKLGETRATATATGAGTAAGDSTATKSIAMMALSEVRDIYYSASNGIDVVVKDTFI